MKALLGVVVKSIGKIWSFTTRLFLIAFVSAFILIVLTIFMPANVLQAIEIFKGLIP